MVCVFGADADKYRLHNLCNLGHDALSCMFGCMQRMATSIVHGHRPSLRPATATVKMRA